ncbi:hypothetical protein [Bradyrhizobium pachyrhizi]|uniref:hypothetical protein n=1 Tax=Bradyrhizobium pachyrhizi TaxID=280333 RepID=UPI0032219A4D
MDIGRRYEQVDPLTAIPLTESALTSVKRAVRQGYPNYKSSHLTEAIAAACGFASHAALRARMLERAPAHPDFALLEELPFLSRLAAMTGVPTSHEDLRGFSFDRLNYEGADVIPTASKGVTKVKYDGSRRRRAWRNVMVAGINAGIDQGLFTPRAGENSWPLPDPRYGDDGRTYRFMIEDISAIASVRDAGWDELSIHVALWPAIGGERWVRTANGGFLAGEVFASGWLERRDGAWLQVGDHPEFGCRKQRLDLIAALDIRPKGYADRGSFRL